MARDYRGPDEQNIRDVFGDTGEKGWGMSDKSSVAPPILQPFDEPQSERAEVPLRE